MSKLNEAIENDKETAVSAAAGGLNGLTVGWGKYLTAAMAYTADRVRGSKKPLTWDEALQFTRETNAALAEKHPVAYTAGEVAGSLAPGAAVARAAKGAHAVAAATTAVKAAKVAAPVAEVLGSAAIGASHAAADDKNITEGAIFGGAAGTVGAVGSRVLGKVVPIAAKKYREAIAPQLKDKLITAVEKAEAAGEKYLPGKTWHSTETLRRAINAGGQDLEHLASSASAAKRLGRHFSLKEDILPITVDALKAGAKTAGVHYGAEAIGMDENTATILASAYGIHGAGSVAKSALARSGLLAGAKAGVPSALSKLELYSRPNVRQAAEAAGTLRMGAADFQKGQAEAMSILGEAGPPTWKALLSNDIIRAASGGGQSRLSRDAAKVAGVVAGTMTTGTVSSAPEATPQKPTTAAIDTSGMKNPDVGGWKKQPTPPKKFELDDDAEWEKTTPSTKKPIKSTFKLDDDAEWAE